MDRLLKHFPGSRLGSMGFGSLCFPAHDLGSRFLSLSSFSSSSISWNLNQELEFNIQVSLLDEASF